MLGSLGTRCSVSLLRAEGSGMRAQPRTERAQHRHLRDKGEAGGESSSQRKEERENLQPLEILWSWYWLNSHSGQFRVLV